MITQYRFLERQTRQILSWKKIRMIIPDFSKNSDKLIPVIVQDFETKEVLMAAYIDQNAFNETIKTGFAHYFSRSRNKLWKKGETSGNIQKIIEIKIDCDEDCVLYLVQQTGPACHTGNKTCFYRTISQEKNEAD